MTADEPTAIRRAARTTTTARWHQLVAGGAATYCGLMSNTSRTERVPLSQTAPEDRCRTCWPTTKDVTP